MATYFNTSDIDLGKPKLSLIQLNTISKKSIELTFHNFLIQCKEN